jgi:hypothetical protein
MAMRLASVVTAINVLVTSGFSIVGISLALLALGAVEKMTQRAIRHCANQKHVHDA